MKLSIKMHSNAKVSTWITDDINVYPESPRAQQRVNKSGKGNLKKQKHDNVNEIKKN